jgi:hypothetical protein
MPPGVFGPPVPGTVPPKFEIVPLDAASQPSDKSKLDVGDPLLAAAAVAGVFKSAGGAGPNLWDSVVSAHPDPGTIDASGAKMHVIWGDQANPEAPNGGGHFYEAGIAGKTVFPESWDENKIMARSEDGAKNPDQRPILQENGRYLVTGTRDGVTIEVIVNQDGTVRTAYPTGGVGVCFTDEHGDPHPIPNQQNLSDEEAANAAAQGETEAEAEAAAKSEVDAQAKAEADAAAAQAQAQAAAAEAEAEAEAEAMAMAEAEAMAMEAE